MSDSKAPLLPHELDAIPDAHLRERILATLEAAQVQSTALAEDLEERINNARDEGRSEAEAEWGEKYEGVWKLAQERSDEARAAVEERDALYRAVDLLLIHGLLKGKKKDLKKGLLQAVELLRQSEMIDAVDEAELQGAADFLAKAAT